MSILFRLHEYRGLLLLALEYPIPNLEASLFASSSRTTVIAIQRSALIPLHRNLDHYHRHEEIHIEDDDDDDSVLIFTCTKLLPSLQSPFQYHTRMSKRIRRHRPHHEELPSSSDLQNESLHCLNEPLGLTLVATGLTSDTRYLVQTAKQYLTLLHYVYPTDDSYSYHSLATHKFVKDAIAQTLQRATEVRPLGVQCLVVGNNKKKNGRKNTSSSLCIYTVDPSGTWKHWGSGITCIGLYADTIRSHLHKIITSFTNTTQDAKTSDTNNHTNTVPWEQQALELAIQAWLQTLLLEDNDDVSSIHGLLDNTDLSIVKHSPSSTSPYLQVVDTDIRRGSLDTRAIDTSLVLENNGLHIHAMVVMGDEQVKKNGVRWDTITPSLIHEVLRVQIQNSKKHLPTFVP